MTDGRPCGRGDGHAGRHQSHESITRYRSSEKYRAVKARYKSSEKGRATSAMYLSSEKARVLNRASTSRYATSEKGRARMARYKSSEKFRAKRLREMITRFIRRHEDNLDMRCPA